MVALRRLGLCLAVCALLAGCDSWLGERQGPPLPGKRISVLAHAQDLQADKAEPTKIVLPVPEQVADWPQAGGYPPHAMYHLQLADTLHEVWTADVGSGGDKRRAYLTPPVAAQGRVFAMDAESQLSAFALKDGKRLWRVDLAPEDSDGGSYGGGVAFDSGKLYVTTAFAELVVLDAGSGKILWRRSLPAPVRGAPTVRGGRVLLITVENETLALAAEDGHELWHHNGLAEVAAMMGGNSPAVDGNVVIVPYTSGEIFALRIENGTAIWSDVVTGIKRTDQVATLTDIRALPVVANNRVFAVGNSDMIAAIDLHSGRRLWDREIGSIHTPWLAGDYLYLITTTSELACLEAKTGRVMWVTPLQEWRNEEDKIGRMVWTGPLVASDRVVVVSKDGDALAVSPYTGKILGRIDLPDGVDIPPIIADGTLLFLTGDAELVAYR